MVSATYPLADPSASIVRQNMARTKLYTVAGPLLCHPAQVERIIRAPEESSIMGSGTTVSYARGAE